MKNFKQLKVWQKGFAIAVNTFRFSATLPKEEKFGLSSQITRAAVSIPSNIAEGSSRTSDKDYARFVEISLGSCFELETQLLIAQQVGLGNNDLQTQLLQDLDEEEKMLIAFKSRLNT
ncbi:four helix bundle protein [Flavisolibacter sp. BT320]|nr:four helix bundle protein [Flavisolibacter longurius]